MERFHAESHDFAHAPHLPVTAFVDPNVERRTVTLRSRESDIRGAGAHSRLQRHPRAQANEL